jgi:type II secretory pathway pseudopilin PulG
MGTAHRCKAAAFTRVELVVVLVVITVISLLAMKLAGLRAFRNGNRRWHQDMQCVNNLKQIGTAYRIWANDHDDQFPAFASQINCGWNEVLYRTNASTYVWTNYALMSNELGLSPTILICPADERQPANSFSNQLDNKNISYFVGVNANDQHPQQLLGGDRNMGPGMAPDSDYGFSPASGQGNDVVINGQVSWSLKMHSHGDPAGRGNILLGDGSVNRTTSHYLYVSWVKYALADMADRAQSTNSPGLRLIFP